MTNSNMIIPINKKVINKIKINKKRIEKKLNINFILENNNLIIKGNPLEEYSASIFFDALNVGFSTEIAMQVLDEGITFEKINIKDYTRRKNLDIVRSRLIGKHGRTKKTLEEISNSKIIIQDNYVSIICHADSINNTLTAIINIIKGSKQTNAYKFLERINTNKKKQNRLKYKN